MSNVTQFQLHSTRLTSDEPDVDDLENFAFSTFDDEPETSVLSMELDADEPTTVWVAEVEGQLRTVDDVEDSVAGFTAVHRKLGPELAMLVQGSSVLVNALPSPGFHVLNPSDSMVLAPGLLTYVTALFQPHVGPPLDVHLGLKCACCKMGITKDTRIVTCRCGCIYHDENADSHPELNDDDRLQCFRKVRHCLVCHRPLSLEPTLLWDPATIE